MSEQTNEQAADAMKTDGLDLHAFRKAKCKRCGHIQLAYTGEKPLYTKCDGCKSDIYSLDWLYGRAIEQPILPLPTDHDVISKPLEQAMVDALRKPKRVRMFKEDYQNECIQLRVENHALKCEVEKLKDTAKERVFYFEGRFAKYQEDAYNQNRRMWIERAIWLAVTVTAICCAMMKGL